MLAPIFSVLQVKKQGANRLKSKLNWRNHLLQVQTVHLAVTRLHFTLDKQMHHC